MRIIQVGLGMIATSMSALSVAADNTAFKMAQFNQELRKDIKPKAQKHNKISQKKRCSNARRLDKCK